MMCRQAMSLKAGKPNRRREQADREPNGRREQADRGPGDGIRHSIKGITRKGTSTKGNTKKGIK